jgi:hypothetical protein
MITLLILGTRYHIDESGYISANNLYIQLSEIIKVNILNKIEIFKLKYDNKSNIKEKETISKIENLIKKTNLHAKTALSIVECAIDSNLIIKKMETKHLNNKIKTIAYYKIDDTILKELIHDIILEKTILPLLKYENEKIDDDLDLKIDESILISDNQDCHLSVSCKYKNNIEYLNSIPMRINLNYLSYLNNLT